MSGVYAPFIYTGGSHWLKHHLLLLDARGSLVSIQPFQEETAQTIACTGILFPAFPESVANTPEEALTWLIDSLAEEQGATVKVLLERLFPRDVLEIGQPVVLWNLQDVYPDAGTIDSDAVVNQLYP